MKKIDVLILKAFIGPFFLTTVVCTFVLLTQYMLKYFDDFVGKDLGASVFAELIMYFSVNMLPVALPLGVLLSSLMTFGNLGEHFELTAIKSAGISLIRALLPIGIFVFFLTIGAFFFNNHVVPTANLNAYSLLFDIKNKKPALDIREGQFYNGIDGYSIKANEKFPDNKTLKTVIIYDHSNRKNSGNKVVILADSAIMYTVLNERYLRFELYNGKTYNEIEKRQKRKKLDSRYLRNSFDKMDMMFSLASFDIKKTKKELFQNNRQMKNVNELSKHIDSLNRRIDRSRENLYFGALAFYQFHYKDELNRVRDSINGAKLKPKPDSLRLKGRSKEKQASVIDLRWLFTENSVLQEGKNKDKKKDNLLKNGRQIDTSSIKKNQDRREESDGIEEEEEEAEQNKKAYKKSKKKVNPIKNGSKVAKNKSVASGKFIKLDTSLVAATKDTINGYFEKFKYKKTDVLNNAAQKARNIKNSVSTLQRKISADQKNVYKYTVEKYKKYSQSAACLIMFLIGAPLGAIIKKGGLGVPVIVSIAFFITYYVLNITSEKSAKEGLINGKIAVWYANLILLPFGLYFLSRARIDARLFEWDSYVIWFQKLIKNKSK